LADRRARAEQALARVRAGEAFEVVAREMSEGPNRERGGAIGLRPVDRLPDLFVSATRGLAVGDVTPEPLRSPAGWHVLKLLDRKLPNDSGLVETHARHILLRTSDEARPEQAAQRLLQLRRQIESGARKFEDVAREVSEDGSAAQGGDLGWFGPGVMVPEFEEPLARLPVGAISDPVLSRFGVHLVQVLDRRPLVLTDAQKREQVRNVLRERKFKQAYADWVRELRSQAYIERRDTR
ncbi:MAG: peptidylprolyl isomerase, partial [Rubrivivax sp.]|nr:peptidylprolyl isomerase [Rubrivivax sp.]